MNKKTTVLYIDDEPINLMLFAANFAAKFEVISAESGFEGLKLLAEFPKISVVISDMKMPGMNGIEFIEQAQKKYPEKFYFILSGYGLTSEIAAAVKNKLIHKYFVKPFDVKAIEKTIGEVTSLGNA